MDSLAPWRDLALVLLVVYTIIIVLVPGVAFFFALKGLRALKRRIREPLRLAQVWAVRIQHGTVRATDAVAGVPIALNSASTAAAVTVRSLVDFLSGR